MRQCYKCVPLFLVSAYHRLSHSLKDGTLLPGCVPLFGVTANLEGSLLHDVFHCLRQTLKDGELLHDVFRCLELWQTLKDGELLHDVFRCLELRQSLKDEALLHGVFHHRLSHSSENGALPPGCVPQFGARTNPTVCLTPHHNAPFSSASPPPSHPSALYEMLTVVFQQKCLFENRILIFNVYISICIAMEA